MGVDIAMVYSGTTPSASKPAYWTGKMVEHVRKVYDFSHST